MSAYTDYDSVSRNYDLIRTPFGSDKIIDAISTTTGKTMRDLHVLDAGCGTGNYTLELLKAGVGKISMFDASIGMLNQARQKVEPYSRDGRITAIKEGLLPGLPFGNETFDAVMFNMVLHHLVDDQVDERSARFNVISAVFQDTARVLKPGGVLVVTTCLPEQYPAIWYANILPEVTDRMARRFPIVSELRGMLHKNGFVGISLASFLGVEWAKDYWTAEGPLQREWRNLDSYWSIFSEEEIKAVVEKTEEMKAKGILRQFMLDHDGSETEGHFTLVCATKG